VAIKNKGTLVRTSLTGAECRLKALKLSPLLPKIILDEKEKSPGQGTLSTKT